MPKTLARALAFVAVLAGGAAAAQSDSRLLRLDTGDDARGWEAVGRLDLDGRGFCTGALVAPDRVLTAAHCLFDRTTGKRLDPARIEFRAGWRNGRASAYRRVRRAVVHPGYRRDPRAAARGVRNDLALLELQRPIERSRAEPFATQRQPRKGQRIGIVSYAKGREAAPSLQQACRVLARQQGVLVMSCDVDHGASGAPVFSFSDGVPRVVSVVSAMAEVAGRKVSLGTELARPLAELRTRLDAGHGVFQDPPPQMVESGTRRDIGAKFAQP